VALAFNIKVNKEIRFYPGMLKPRSNTMKKIWIVGFPAALQQAISPIMIFGMNQILLGFTAAAPAVYVIYVRLQSIILIPIWGLKNTVVSIISYNFGAGKKKRIQETIRICLIATVVITCLGVVLFHIIPDQLLALFNAQGEVLSIGRVALRIVSFVFPFSGMILILGAFFQALGHSGMTLATSLSQLVIMLVSAMILARFGTVHTVWFAFVITEVIVSMLAICLMRKVSKTTINRIREN
ncbi:MAG: MATE family efflux transporter, partial [Lachnospiraceae bacterium]|nr:MATE family efflux transporter [Lachnospiraceae bacterium]